MASNGIAVQFHLPCGCSISHRMQFDVTDNPDDYNRRPEAFRHMLNQAAQTLGYWATLRGRFHKCQLVSEGNPNGFDQAAAQAWAREMDDE